jgi:hypothetical protein
MVTLSAFALGASIAGQIHANPFATTPFSAPTVLPFAPAITYTTPPHTRQQIAASTFPAGSLRSPRSKSKGRRARRARAKAKKVEAQNAPKQKQFPETLQGVTKEIGTATSASNTANYSPVSGVLPTTTSMALRDTSSKVGNEPSMVEAECHISHAPGSDTDCHMNKVL